MLHGTAIDTDRGLQMNVRTVATERPALDCMAKKRLLHFYLRMSVSLHIDAAH